MSQFEDLKMQVPAHLQIFKLNNFQNSPSTLLHRKLHRHPGLNALIHFDSFPLGVPGVLLA